LGSYKERVFGEKSFIRRERKKEKSEVYIVTGKERDGPERRERTCWGGGSSKEFERKPSLKQHGALVGPNIGSYLIKRARMAFKKSCRSRGREGEKSEPVPSCVWGGGEELLGGDQKKLKEKKTKRGRREIRGGRLFRRGLTRSAAKNGSLERPGKKEFGRLSMGRGEECHGRVSRRGQRKRYMDATIREEVWKACGWGGDGFRSTSRRLRDDLQLTEKKAGRLLENPPIVEEEMLLKREGKLYGGRKSPTS